jgi:hypothetical protein
MKPQLFLKEPGKKCFRRTGALPRPREAVRHPKESAAKFLKELLAPSVGSRCAMVTMAAAWLTPGPTVAPVAP